MTRHRKTITVRKLKFSENHSYTHEVEYGTEGWHATGSRRFRSLSAAMRFANMSAREWERDGHTVTLEREMPR